MQANSERQAPSFETLVAGHLGALFQRALRLTWNQASAEDLLQETLLRAWRSFHTFRPDSNVWAWLSTILRHAYIDGYRKTSRRPEIIDRDLEDEFYLHSRLQRGDEYRLAGNPEELLLARLVTDDIKGALDGLPDGFRAVMALAGIEGLSYRQIAKVLDIPVGTVMSRLHRSRRRLRVKLGKYAVE